MNTIRCTITRRQFLQTSAAATAWAMTASSYGRIFGANARLNVAYVGVGGIAGGQHIAPLAALGAGCPCFTDPDQARWGPAVERWSSAAGFTDYRRMFDKHHADIDAVMVGTPDHHHFPATMIAMSLGKHVYTQKPLTHTPWEARQLTLAQKKYKLATQMGNQGHASEELRLTIDYLRSGAIGDLKEAHVWTDRPWWRQGLPRPEGAEAIPSTMDWDSWLGPAPERPYRHNPADRWGGLYHPFNWRGWWDFGCGALGDMACHEVDPVYWAMNPGYPTAVELVAGEPIGDGEMYNKATTVRYEFPAAGDRPAFVLFWHDGGRKPDRPEELAADVQMTSEGALYIGSKGKMICLPNAKAPPRLLPAARHEEFGKAPQMIERSADGHHKEWYLACTGEKPYDFPKSNFAYAGPFTEMILLGCVAQKVGGRLLYNPDSMKFTNNESANAFISKTYRKGWEYKLD